MEVTLKLKKSVNTRFSASLQDSVVKHSVHTLVFRSLKRTHDMFLCQEGQAIPEDELAYVFLLFCFYSAKAYLNFHPKSETEGFVQNSGRALPG